MVTNYAEAAAKMNTAQSKLAGKPLGNNTRLMLDGENYQVVLHGTPIVTYKPNGDIVLFTNGYWTVTTKRRMNQCTPNHIHVFQCKGEWYCGNLDKGTTEKWADDSDMLVINA